MPAAARSPRAAATARAVTHLLNYAATHPDAILRFRQSAMILHVHSDASYLSESKARSRAGGFFYLSSADDPVPTSPLPPLNGAIHVPSSILDVVVSSAAEAKLGALFFNAKDAAWLRTSLEALGYPQPATPIQTDNACAAGICNDSVKQRRSKAMDMRFYWVRDRVRTGPFRVHWRPGQDNLADYFTKHHSPAHHRSSRATYLHAPAPSRLPLPAPQTLPAGEGVLITSTTPAETLPSNPVEPASSLTAVRNAANLSFAAAPKSSIISS